MGDTAKQLEDGAPKMPRLLYLLPGLVPPNEDDTLQQAFYLSDILEGDILLPVWWRSPSSASGRLAETFPIHHVRRFCYHLFLSYRFPSRIRGLASFFFFVHKGILLHRQRKFDAIMTYGTNVTGLAGVALKLLTGAKLIAEIPGTPQDSYQVISPSKTRGNRLKKRISDLCLHIVVRASDCVKLLYPTQLDAYPALRHKPVAVFHDFVPLRRIRSEPGDGTTVLTVGYPWYTKGVDILIRAFKSIASQVPNHRMQWMGFCSTRDRAYLETLASGCDRIEFIGAGGYQQALQTISSCAVFVLPSRSEGMGRVLLEAMAARKPIIVSAVGGTPFYVSDNDNGLLFRSEDVSDLAEKLLTLLSNPDLAERLAASGQERALSEFDETAYVRNFQKMIEMIGIPAPSGTGADMTTPFRPIVDD